MLPARFEQAPFHHFPGGDAPLTNAIILGRNGDAISGQDARYSLWEQAGARARLPAMEPMKLTVLSLREEEGEVRAVVRVNTEVIFPKGAEVKFPTLVVFGDQPRAARRSRRLA